MKFIIPEIEIPEEQPFKNDEFERQKYAKVLTNLIKNIDDPFVISIDAQWGEGKTTFVKMWQAYLKKEGFHVIYFDAFANDYIEDAFVAIVSEISNYFDKIGNKEKVKAFQKKAVKVGSQLIGLAARIGVKALTMGAIKETDLEVLKDIKDDLTKGFSEIIGSLIKEKIESYNIEKQTVEDFKDELSKLAANNQKDQKGKLIIFIDELDRCKPTFAVEIIERIKHIFLTQNTVFVLVMYKKQLEEAVRAVYGFGIDANTYLQKFINIETTLPKRQEPMPISDYYKYIKKLFYLHEIKNEINDKNYLIDCLTSLASHFNLSLRQLEKVFVNIALFYASIKKEQLRLIEILSFVSIIKVINMDLFKKLSFKKVSYDELIAETALPKIKEDQEPSNKIEDISQILMLCLVEQTKDNNDKIDYFMHNFVKCASIKREEIIPYHCHIINLIQINW